MACINHLNIGVSDNSHAGNSAGVIVNFRDLFFEDAASDKYFFFVETLCFGFINRCWFMQDLIDDFTNQLVGLKLSVWKIVF